MKTLKYYVWLVRVKLSNYTFLIKWRIKHKLENGLLSPYPEVADIDIEEEENY